MNRNRITKSSAIGYAIDVAVEGLIDDIEHGEYDDLQEVKDLLMGMIRHAPRAQRRYWAHEITMRRIP